MNNQITSAQVGRKFRELRQKLNWSQSIAAQKLDISIPAYSKIETGITDLNISRFIQLCNLYEVEPVEIIAASRTAELNSDITAAREELAAARQEVNVLQKKLITVYEKLDQLSL